uniref:Uncharacterized protein n=1 Tax=Rhizophora mucronata TaxID=61149 RepID=A0A2P2JQY9_RHIMU
MNPKHEKYFGRHLGAQPFQLHCIDLKRTPSVLQYLDHEWNKILSHQKFVGQWRMLPPH